MTVKIIGITGGIGSGKSTVAQWIEKQGYPVYYSDERAKQIVNEDISLKNAIIQLLGEESYTSDGYNRKYVAQKVFGDSGLLQALNQLIHPAVAKDFEQWKTQISTPFAFKETALLFEHNLHKDLYKSILVTAQDEIRIQRVIKRDQKTRTEVEAIMRKQMPEAEKMNKADFIIHNNGTPEALLPKVQSVLQRII